MPAESTLRRLALEGLVIVSSILLAFAIDAGWDAVQEAREREELLDQLGEEIAMIEEIVLPQADANAENIALATSRLLQRIHGGPNDVPADTLLLDIARLGRGYRFAAALPVLEILAGDGGFDRVEDPRLRSALSQLVAYVSLVREFEASDQTFVATELRPYLTENFDEYGARRRAGRDYTDGPPSRFDSDASLNRLLSDPRFSAIVVTRDQMLATTRRFRASVGMWADSVKVALDAR